MPKDNWVIAGEPDGSVPEIGQTYRVFHTRKGDLVVRILDVRGYWADCELLEGTVKWRSKENKMFRKHDTHLTIRASLVHLTKIDEDTNV